MDVRKESKMAKYSYDTEATLLRDKTAQKLRSRMQSLGISESKIKRILRKSQRGCIFNVPLVCVVEEEIQKFLDNRKWRHYRVNTNSNIQVKRDNEKEVKISKPKSERQRLKEEIALLRLKIAKLEK